jgi:hypothetical protein
MLYWQGHAPIASSYTVFTHLEDASGRIIAQQDNVPGGGNLPTTSWQVGSYVRDGYSIMIPPGTPAGNYRLVVGMYSLSTMQRLPVSSASGASLGNSVTLATVRVR